MSPSPQTPDVEICLIAAAGENDVIGRDGDLPWHLPDDLKHFKRLTTGHPVIMGRRTFESFGRPLPDRLNIVITRRDDWSHQGVVTAASLDEAILQAGEQDAARIFIAGGEQIYRAALPIADVIHLTRVHATPQGDVHFPAIDPARWTLVDERHHPADDRHEHAMTFREYHRTADG